MPLSELTPEQAAAIRTIAGDDPERQRAAVEKLAPTWTPPPKTPTEILAEARSLNPFYVAEFLERRLQVHQSRPLADRIAEAQKAEKK